MPPRIPKRSIYADIYVKGSHRARFTPRVARPWRPRVIAWAGPTAFYPNRFYEMDKWYKARITKPEIIPQLHVIDPDKYTATIEERLQEPEVKEAAINIGYKEKILPVQKPSISKEEIERLSWKRQLKIDLNLLNHYQRNIVKHYRIFDDLFGEGVYFNITQIMRTKFGKNIAYYGNILEASHAKEKPSITIESVGHGYNTLMIINLDGNPYLSNTELLHWFVSNIEDGKSVAEGTEEVPYLQPLPFKDTGYHRLAIILFHHEKQIDFTAYRPKSNSLFDRSFKMQKFYKLNEDEITPSSISFIQVIWDMSVNYALHTLDLKCPLYKYRYNLPLKIEQKEFSNKPQPFDLYLDQFRDPLEMEGEVLKKRLRMSSVESEPKQPIYPDINYVENKKVLPAWIHSKLIKENSGSGRFFALWNNPID